MRFGKVAAALLLVSLCGFLLYSCMSRPTDTSTHASEEPPAKAPSVATTSAPAPSTTSDPAPEPPNTESAAAEDVARQALTVAFTWYPSTDATQNDAYGRARQWLTLGFAERMSTDASTERGPSVQWGQWSRQQAKIVADVRIGCSGCPDDTDSTIHRVATIEQTAITESGTDTVDPDTTVWVTLVRQDEGWLVDDVRY